VWEEPAPLRTYALGIDFAFGLATGDYDAAVMLRDDGEQVAQLHGHWGERFGEQLWPLIDWYGRSSVFVVGEPTATGLPILRELYDRGCWLYYHRAEQAKGRPVLDQLGHVPGKLDITVQWLRRDIRPTGNRKLIIRDATLLAEMQRFSFMPRRQGASLDGTRDSGVTWGAPPGEHDDLVRALALANAGLEWLPQFEPPKAELPPQSIGAILGYDDDDEPKRPSVF
jgi:hypothetical protein